MLTLVEKDLNGVSIPVYIQIYNYFKDEIINGTLEENKKLPSVRKLAEDLKISTTPVEMAYDQLLEEGFITSVPRSGYFIHKVIETIQKDTSSKHFNHENVLPRNKKFTFDFHLSKNEFTYFPFKIWKRLYCQCVDTKHKDLLFYGDPQGEEGLRREISKYLKKYRGVECRPNQIIIGAEQHQLAAILSLILKPTSTKLAVENPAYPLILETFKQGGYEICSIDLEEDGINIDRLYQSGARIVHVSPSHQFPKGMLLPISKRLKLLNWAKEINGYIIEDDYDGEFRYHGRPIPSLQGIIPNNNVIYMGGFSQVLAPSICINYMVLPEILVEKYKDVKYSILLEQASSRLHQKTMELFMKKGYLERYMRKMSLIYKRKHDAVVESLKWHFGDKINIQGLNAGFHLFLEIEHTTSEGELQSIAENAQIRIASAGYTYFKNKKDDINKELDKRQFILGFAGIEEDKIDDGIKLLSNVWFPSELGTVQLFTAKKFEENKAGDAFKKDRFDFC